MSWTSLTMLAFAIGMTISYIAWYLIDRKQKKKVDK